MKTNITGIIDNVAGATISASPGTLSMESIGGSVDLSINCKIGWKIIDLPDFVSVSDVRGHGNKTVRITFAENRSTSDRSGSFKVKSSRGEIITISVSQSKAVIDWVYTFNVSPTSLSFEKTVESKSVTVTSYKTPYIHGTVSGANVDVSYTLRSNQKWCATSTSSIIVTENPNTSTRTASVTYTQAESAKSAVVSVTQEASVWTWKYGISVDSTSWTSPATPSSKDITVSAWRQKYLNGRVTDTQVAVGYSVSNNLSFVSVTKTSTGATVSTTNNTTSSSRSGSFTITPTLDNTTSYPLEGTNTSATFTVTQEAGAKIYSDITASLSYSADADAIGGTCSPTLSYSQTYTWNGISGSGGNVSTSSFSIGNYTMQSTTTSINATSGVVTWGENQSLNARTSGTISVTVTGLGGYSKIVTSTCGQKAGYYTYNNISFDALTYGAVNSGGGTSSPSIKYTQTYGWNGATSGAGTITGGTNDDDYTTYSVPTTTGLTLNTSTGVATWDVNKGTSGSEDSTTRSATITASVTRNGKSASTTAVASQTGEKEEGPSNISYGEWSFSITPSVTSFTAKGGSSTMTLTRPTRTVTKTYLSGDVVTYNETATAGTFTFTRSNSTFTLSTTSANLTSNTVPTVTLSVGATGAVATSAISSTVTAAFTATNPTTGTTTKSVTSTSVTRAASVQTGTEYQFSTFSVGQTSFTAAGGSTTLSMVLQQRNVYTEYQVTSWETFRPVDGRITVYCSDYAQAGSITYGTTSTCNIQMLPNYSTSAGRSATVYAQYTNSSWKSSTITLNQSADATTTITYGTPSVSFSYGTKNAAAGTINPSGSWSQSRTQNYVSGNTSGLTAVTGTIDDSYTNYAVNTANSAATLHTTSGAVNWQSNTSSSSRSCKITATVTVNGKSGSATATCTQSADAISSTSYGDVTKGTITNATIPASGTTTNYTATAGNGSQVITYSWVSGKSNTSETKTISPSHPSSISATAGSKGTTASDVTVVKSQAVTWSGYGGKSASDTMYIYQAANSYSTTNYGSWSYNWTTTDNSTRTRSVTEVWSSGNHTKPNQTETGGTRYLVLNKEDYNGAAQHVFEANGAGSATFTIMSHDYWGSTYIHTENISGASCSCSGFTCSASGSTLTVTAPHLGTTPTDAKRATIVISKSGFVTRTGYTYIEQKANLREVSSVYFVPYKPDASWIVNVNSNGEWSTVPASGGYVKCNGYVNYSHSSGDPLPNQHITSDAALTWSTGHGDWITNHSNGGYYIHDRCTSDGNARSSVATWTYGGKTSAGKTLTQEANTHWVSSYGSWEAVSSWSSWADYDYPYADTTGNYWASCSIGSGITCAGGSATVSKSAGHTVYHYKRQRRSGTQYRDINYVWTSGCTWTHDNGSSQTVYEYQQVSNGSSSASDSCTIAIVSNPSGRFSLSGTTLSHSNMGKNLVTDTCTVRCTNSAYTSATNDASVSVTNTVGGWYDNGSWGGWSDTGSAYYVGGEWEGGGSDYWAACSIGSGITAGTSSATISASAGHNRNFYKSRNIATIRYMPTRRDYCSGSYDTSSRSETSARAYDSVWQRNAATSDSVNLSEISDNHGRFSISGTSLNHSTMGTSATTDSCTVRCTNGSAASVYKDASVNVTNSKNAGTYSIASSGNVSFGYATGGAPRYKVVSSYYKGTYTSGASYSDWVNFSINSKPSWAQIDKYGDSELQITVDDNNSVYSRSGTVTLLQSTSGKATSFTITQEGAPKTVYLIDVMPENDSNISIMFSEALSNPITLRLYVEDQRYWNSESIKVELSPGSESYFIDVSNYSSLSRVDWVCVESIDYEGPEQVENYAQSC